ncbi:glycosyltransferase family 39 protein [bacterium]|nr:glycosyltransferase family 39 protein [bacterium]
MKNSVNNLNCSLLYWLVFLVFSIAFLFFNARDLSGSFYWDEAVYANISDHLLYSDYYYPFQTVFTRHPPLYFIILKVLSWIPVRHEISFRIFSILTSIIGIAFLFYIFAEFKRYRLGVLFLVLMFLNTVVQQYSQSATMYALFFMFYSMFITGLIQKKKTLELVGIIGGIYTHYLMFFAWLFIFAVEFYLNNKRISKEMKTKIVIIMIAYSPWLLFSLPGLFFRLTQQYRDFLAYINLYNFVWTFGLTGILFISFWVYKIIKCRFACFESDEIEIRFITVVTILSLGYLLIFLFGIPFLRYLFFIIPSVYAAILLISARLAEKEKNKIRKCVMFSASVIMIFVPNFQLIGVFPYSFSYHDNHDSIYAQHWEEVVEDVGKNPVAVENVRSFYYYAQKIHPDYYKKSFPWNDIGLVEIKYKAYNYKENMENLKGIDTTFACVDSVGKYKAEMIQELYNMGYKDYKKYGTTLLLKKHSADE